MPSPSRRDNRRSFRVFLAACALVGLLGVTACSSDSSSKSDSPADQNADADRDATGGGDSGEGRPDGFPDIPLPDHSKFDVIKSETDTSPGWSVLFTVDPTLAKDSDEIVTEYADQLEGDGYEIEGDATDASVQATKDDTYITFHSSMDGTITIGVMPN